MSDRLLSRRPANSESLVWEMQEESGCWQKKHRELVGLNDEPWERRRSRTEDELRDNGPPDPSYMVPRLPETLHFFVADLHLYVVWLHFQLTLPRHTEVLFRRTTVQVAVLEALKSNRDIIPGVVAEHTAARWARQCFSRRHRPCSQTSIYHVLSRRPAGERPVSRF